jgi:hypothetical protein
MVAEIKGSDVKMVLSTGRPQSHEKGREESVERTIIEEEGSEGNQGTRFDWLVGRAAVIQAFLGVLRLSPTLAPQRRNPEA